MAFQRLVNFRPGRNIAVTASITATAVAFQSHAEDFMITNLHTATIFFVLGDATADASTTSTPITTLQSKVFRRSIDRGETHISIKALSTTGAVHVTEGEGS